MQTLFKILRLNKVSLGFSLSLCLLPILVSSSSAYWLIENESLIRNFSSLDWAGFYLLAAVTMAFALTPSTFICILSGYLLGWESLPAVILSYLLACLICYFLAHKLDKGKFLNSIRNIEGVQSTLDKLQTHELRIVILSKISPVLPFSVSNILLSLGGVSLKNFLFGGLIGMLPRTALSIWIGISTLKIQELIEKREFGGYHLIIAGLIVVSILGLYLTFKGGKNKKSP